MEIIDSDKRVWQRFSARFPVKFKDSRNGFGNDVFLRNISAEGVKLLTRDRFFLDDKVSFFVKLPDGHSPVLLNGEVVWAKPENANLWSLGMRFPTISLIKLSRIFKLCEE